MIQNHIKFSKKNGSKKSIFVSFLTTFQAVSPLPSSPPPEANHRGQVCIDLMDAALLSSSTTSGSALSARTLWQGLARSDSTSAHTLVKDSQLKPYRPYWKLHTFHLFPAERRSCC